jgi:penicillin-binding protein 2
MWDKQELEKREKLRVLIVIIIGVAVLLIGRLAWMQLIQGPQYKKTAESNRIRNITQTAPRGTIYDRNGNILVANRPSFAVSIIPAEYNNAAEATPLLAAITGLTEDEINARLAKGQSKAYDPVRLKRDADAAMLTKIQERKQYMPGVIIEAMPVSINVSVKLILLIQ